ncbi:GNAT family N-acetyltransferase [Paenibacillus alkalitolerans]|uniref:GNAT family N-acetyltransferase n=1 Tax=Paenibacillus alkalitolerans TaxID=2799335 RepID=UPI001F4632A5|nr:GNAT family N-acetyltransferase [Paenibacillus alkalitolerans]
MKVIEIGIRINFSEEEVKYMFSKRIDEQLDLRILDHKHVYELYKVTDENRNYLSAWLPWVGETTGEDSTRNFIRNSLKHYADNTGLNCGIFYNNSIVGCIGFHGFDWANLKTSLGYWLAEAYQGKGIMTKSCITMIDYSIKELGFNRIEIRAGVENYKSRAIPERLNFKQEGILRKVEKVGDKYLDHVVYAMIADDWLTRESSISTKIEVVPYNPNWPLQFEQEKARLLEILHPKLVAIEHTGSTSVPRVDAKPIIDIFAAVRPFEESSVYAELLRESGYQLIETGMYGRYLFVKQSNGTRTHHLHILPEEGFYERNEFLFRDYLRAHPELVEEYGELKRNLSQQYSTDPEGYTRAKTSFIQRVVDRAREERGLPLQNVWEE